MKVDGIERTHGWILLTLAALWAIASIVSTPVSDDASLWVAATYIVVFTGVYWVLLSLGMDIIQETGGLRRE